MSSKKALTDGSVASPLLCQSCGANPYPEIDVCKLCGGDFGESGEDGNGYNCTCTSCRKSNSFQQCCKNCREPFPVEMRN